MPCHRYGKPLLFTSIAVIRRLDSFHKVNEVTSTSSSNFLFLLHILVSSVALSTVLSTGNEQTELAHSGFLLINRQDCTFVCLDFEEAGPRILQESTYRIVLEASGMDLPPCLLPSLSLSLG